MCEQVVGGISPPLPMVVPGTKTALLGNYDYPPLQTGKNLKKYFFQCISPPLLFLLIQALMVIVRPRRTIDMTGNKMVLNPKSTQRKNKYDWNEVGFQPRDQAEDRYICLETRPPVVLSPETKPTKNKFQNLWLLEHYN